jgi:mono/diheme cytochrome c family protein
MIHAKLAASIIFMAAGTVAVLTMLYVMGRPEKKISPGALRNTHRVTGLIFTVSLIVLAWIGVRFVGAMGDGMSLRAVFHAVFATSLIAVLLLKILIVKFYRELMRFVPTMGLIAFGLAFVVFSTSTGFHFARDLRPGASAPVEVGESMPGGDVKAGRTIFNKNCLGCHNADSRKSLFGPGLLGLMKWETLRSTGEPPTPDSVREQIVNPVGTMPAFTTFSEKEMNDLLTYLGTL